MELTKEEARRVLTTISSSGIDEGVEVLIAQSKSLDYNYFNELYDIAYKESAND